MAPDSNLATSATIERVSAAVASVVIPLPPETVNVSVRLLAVVVPESPVILSYILAVLINGSAGRPVPDKPAPIATPAQSISNVATPGAPEIAVEIAEPAAPTISKLSVTEPAAILPASPATLE